MAFGRNVTMTVTYTLTRSSVTPRPRSKRLRETQAAAVQGGPSQTVQSVSVPTRLSELTDDLGDSPVHTHGQYLPLAGGDMTGALRLKYLGGVFSLAPLRLMNAAMDEDMARIGANTSGNAAIYAKNNIVLRPGQDFTQSAAQTQGLVISADEAAFSDDVDIAGVLEVHDVIKLIGSGTKKRIYFDASHYLELVYDSTDGVYYLHSNVGIASDSFISAKGRGRGGGGGGGGIDLATVWNALAGNTNEPINISHLTAALAGYQPLIDSSNKLAYSLLSGTPDSLSDFTDDLGDLGESNAHRHKLLIGYGTAPSSEATIANWVEGLAAYHTTAVTGNLPNYATILSVLPKRSSGIRGFQIICEANGKISVRTAGTTSTTWGAISELAKVSHLSAYLPLIGGDLTGALGVRYPGAPFSNPSIVLRNASGTADYARIGATTAGNLGVYTSGNVVLRPGQDFSGSASSDGMVMSKAAATFSMDVTAPNFHGDLDGNAATATNADHADVATNSDKLDGQHLSGIIRQEATPTLGETAGWYTIATIPTTAAGKRSIHEIGFLVNGSNSSRNTPCAVIIRVMPVGYEQFAVNCEGGGGAIDKVRFVPSSGILQVHYTKTYAYGCVTRVANTFSGLMVRADVTPATGTMTVDTTATYTGQEVCLLSGGFASSRDIYSGGAVSAKKTS